MLDFSFAAPAADATASVLAPLAPLATAYLSAQLAWASCKLSYRAGRAAWRLARRPFQAAPPPPDSPLLAGLLAALADTPGLALASAPTAQDDPKGYDLQSLAAGGHAGRCGPLVHFRLALFAAPAATTVKGTLAQLLQARLRDGRDALAALDDAELVKLHEAVAAAVVACRGRDRASLREQLAFRLAGDAVHAAATPLGPPLGPAPLRFDNDRAGGLSGQVFCQNNVAAVPAPHGSV